MSGIKNIAFSGKIWIIVLFSITLIFCQNIGNQNITESDNPNFSVRKISFEDTLNKSFSFKEFSGDSYLFKHYAKSDKQRHSVWFNLQFEKLFNFRDEIILIVCPKSEIINVFSKVQLDSLTFKIVPVPFYQVNGRGSVEFKDNTSSVFIQIRTNHAQKVRFEIVNKATHYDIERNYSLVSGFYAGLLILILLYHVILYAIVKEKAYFYFSLHTAISLLFIITGTGIATNYLPIHLHYISITTLRISLVVLFLTLFKANPIHQNIPIKVLIIIPVYIILGLIQYIFPALMIEIAYNFLHFIILAYFVYISIKQTPSDILSLHVFNFAWILLVLSGFYETGKMLLDMNDLFNTSNICLICFNALISFSLGYKLSGYKDAKILAEKMEIESLTEKENIILEQNNILEQLIQERNKKLIEKIKLLEKTKLEIELKNQTLKNSSLEIEKINNELIAKNLEITKQNKELETHQQNLEKIVKKRTKKLRKSQKKAIVAEKLKTSFLKNLTHEINTPMNAIAGYASLLTDKGISQENRNDLLAKINKYVDILLETVDGIVTLSRIQSGIIKAKYTMGSLPQFFNTTVEQCNEKITPVNHKIQFCADCLFCNEEISGFLDFNKLLQIILLILEAILKLSVEAKIKLVFDRYENNLSHRSGKNLQIRFEIKGRDEQNKPIAEKIIEYINNLEIKPRYTDPVELNLTIASALTGVMDGLISCYRGNENEVVIKIETPVLDSKT